VSWLCLPSLGSLRWEPHRGTQLQAAERGRGTLVLGSLEMWAQRSPRELGEMLHSMQSLQVWGSLTPAPSLLSYTSLVPNPCLPPSKPWRPASCCVCFNAVLVRLRAWVNSRAPSYSCFCSHCVYLRSHWGSPPGSPHSQASCSCE